MSDHVPSYARHDDGRAPPPRSRAPPRGGRHDNDDRSNDRHFDRGYNDRSDDRGSYNDDRRDRDRPDRNDGRFNRDDRRARSPPVNDPSPGDWEYGVVVTVRDSFGFVRGFNRQGPQLFFHASEVRGLSLDQLRAGDEVKFVAKEAAVGSRPSDRDGKANALHVTILTVEDKAPTVLKHAVEGTIVRGLRGRTKHDSYGGRVRIDSVTTETENAAADTNQDTEIADPENDPSTDTKNDKANTEPAGKPASFEILEFSGKDLADSCPRLKEGDAVVFDLVEHKFTQDRGLANLCFVKHAPVVVRKVLTKEPTAGGSTDTAVGADTAGGYDPTPQNLTASGKEIGRVEKLTPSYGFVRKIGGRMEGAGDDGTGQLVGNNNNNKAGPPNPSLFFHYSELCGDTRDRDLSLGSAVSFERGGDGRSGKPTAVNVSLVSETEARDVEQREKACLAAGRLQTSAPPTGSGADRWGKEKRPADTGTPEEMPDPHKDAVPPEGAELGVVSVMKANYGFIKCVDRGDDLFFHFTEVRGGETAVRVGTDVSFCVENRPAPGPRGRGGPEKPVACRIAVAAKGSARFEIVEPAVRVGTCVERLVFPRHPGGYGDRATRGGNEFGNGDGGVPGSVEFALGEGENVGMFGNGGGDEKNATKEGDDETKDEKADDDETNTKKKRLTVRLPFLKSGLVAAKTNPRPGDVCEFRVRIDTRTKRRSACFLVPKRFVGVVVVVKQGGGFGFLEHDNLDFELGDTDSDGGEDETPAETGKETGDVSDPTEEKGTETEPDEPDEPDENDENDPDTAATPTTAFPKTKTIKWEYESEVTDRQKKAAAVVRRLKPGKGKKRVFFHAGDVEGQNVTLREGDEVEFGVTLPSANTLNSNPKASGGRKGDGPSGGGGGKDPQARRIVRTKESPAPVRPTFTNTSKTDFEKDPTGDRPTGTNFTSGRTVAKMASMPDGTKGFQMGRGKGLAEAASAAVSRLKLAVAPFPVGGAGCGSISPAADVALDPAAAEDA